MDIKKKAGVGQASKNQLSKQVLPKPSAQTIIEKTDLIEKAVVGHAKKHFFERIGNLRSVRKSVIIWLVLISILMSVVGIFRVLSQDAYKKVDFADGGTYSEGFNEEIRNLNPLFATTAPERAFSMLAFSRLFNIDTSGKLNTELVSKISTDDDYKNFVVDLRSDAFWSDGHKISADDVIFTINLLKNKTTNPTRYESWKDVKVEKTGDLQMKFMMPASSQLVLHTLNFPILPAHKFENIAVEKIRESDFSQNPVTSGAFNFRSLAKSNTKTVISLEKNQKYFKGAPKLDYFEIAGYDKQEDLVKALQSGEISGTADVAISQIAQSEREKFAENQAPLNRGAYAFMNNSSAIFKDKQVRRAVQSGIDVSQIQKVVGATQGLSLPTLNTFDNIEVPSFGAGKSAQLLDEAGWKLNGKTREKDGQKMRISIATTSEDKFEKSAQSIKTQLEKLGFAVDLVIADKNDKSGNFAQSVLQPRNYDILIYEIDFGSDSDIYAFWHSSQGVNGWNFSKYSDAISDDILLNYRKSSTESQRNAQLERFSKRWISEAPAIGLFRGELKYISRKSVKTYAADNRMVEALNRYADVIYWQANKRELYKTP